MKYYGFSEAKAEEAIAYYREYFRDIGIFENRVYEGVENMLKELYADGKRIILATSKPEEFALRILEYFELKKYFHIVAGASMDSSRSQKSDVIANIKLLKIITVGSCSPFIFVIKNHGCPWCK